MCGISASLNKDKFIELMKLNSYRGNFSYSVMVFDYINKKILYLNKSFGEFDEKIIENLNFENVYYIGHQQSPTGGLIKDYERIHPSILNDDCNTSYLYHNGLLKNDYLKKFNHENRWDTELIHKFIRKDDFNQLGNMQGSFSCLFIDKDKNIKLFRNALSPMFVDKNLNVSSVKFNGCEKTSYNKIYTIDFENKSFNIDFVFNNEELIYFLGE